MPGVNRDNDSHTKENDENSFYLQEAENFYAQGVICNLERRWECARENFDSALVILANLDLKSDKNEKLQKQVDVLLKEIAYDYRFAILSSGFPEGANAPALLSFALDDRLADENIKELADKLPKVKDPTEYDFPIEWNSIVKEKVVYFITDLREPFQKWMNNSGMYMDMIQEVFKEEGLPLDLAYLPLIESGFNPNAYSWAHAVGVWQFISGTGKRFGLRVDWWIDERRDPIKSTYAAAKYLKYLYERFENWPLVLASYNCGEGRVGRQIKNQNVDSYWLLNLPKETRNYVPLYMAAVIVAKQPELFGFEQNPLPKLQFDTVTVGYSTDLRLVATTLGIPIDSLKALNPELLRWATPPDIKNYKLKIPFGSKDMFLAEFNQIPVEKRRADFVEHKVSKGETLSHIAIKYRTSTEAIALTNNIKNKHRLRIGQKLMIPISAGAKKIAKTNYQSGTGDYYTVKKGDNLGSIAYSNNLALRQLCSLNDLNPNSTIYPGQKLLISKLVPSSNTDTDIIHTVARGDALYKIARKYNVTIDDIIYLNNIPDKNVPLRIGQKLTIKKANKTAIKYTVKSGDTISGIAAKYGVTTAQIKEWNSLNSNLIRIDQELDIYSANSEIRGERIVVHKVNKGETLWKIASHYGLSIDDILRENEGLKPTQLRVGEEITLRLNN